MANIINIAIVRPYPTVISTVNYNVQEVGLAKALSPYGFNIDIICAGNVTKISEEVINDFEDNRIRVIRFPFKPLPFSNSYFFGLRKYLNLQRYHLIQTQGYEQFLSFCISIFCYLNHVPVIIHEGVYENDFGRLINFYLRLFNQTFGRIMKMTKPVCLAKTEMAAKRLNKSGFKKIVTLPIGLDIASFPTGALQDWKSKLNLQKHDLLFLYVGVLEPRRNVEFLIRVIKNLHESGFQCHFAIVGKGPSERSCRELVEKLNLSSYVHFTGRITQNNLPGLYRCADLFLLASDYEIVGMVILESLYFGCPVLSSRTAGSKDILTELYGLVIDTLSVKIWGNAIRDIFRSPEKYPFRKNLKNIPLNRTWGHLGKQYRDFYMGIINNP